MASTSRAVTRYHYLSPFALLLNRMPPGISSLCFVPAPPAGPTGPSSVHLIFSSALSPPPGVAGAPAVRGGRRLGGRRPRGRSGPHGRSAPQQHQRYRGSQNRPRSPHFDRADALGHLPVPWFSARGPTTRPPAGSFSHGRLFLETDTWPYVDRLGLSGKNEKDVEVKGVANGIECVLKGRPGLRRGGR